MLQKYSWAAIGRFFPWLESFVASSSCSPDPSSFSKEKSIHKSVLFITASILFLNYLCRLSIVVNSSRFQERFKIRAPQGSAQEGWLSRAMERLGM